MSNDTSGPAFPADIPRINTVTPVTSLSPAPVTLDAIRRIVREEIRANAALEAAARQALEALIENARLLGATQAKKGFGCYSQEDARLERAWHEGIAKHSAALRAALAGNSPATLFDPRGSLGEPIV